MTKIKFKCTGGFQGREIDIVIDVNTLPAMEAKVLLEQIQASDFFELPDDLTGSSAVDEFQYSITVESGKIARHTVHTSDTTMPEALRPLVNELSALAMLNPLQ